jgi:hypothetical protein
LSLEDNGGRLPNLKWERLDRVIRDRRADSDPAGQGDGDQPRDGPLFNARDRALQLVAGRQPTVVDMVPGIDRDRLLAVKICFAAIGLARLWGVQTTARFRVLPVKP